MALALTRKELELTVATHKVVRCRDEAAGRDAARGTKQRPQQGFCNRWQQQRCWGFCHADKSPPRQQKVFD